MIAGRLVAAWPRPRPAVTGGHVAALVLTAAAIAIRWPHFGDPAYMIDEQFYTFVGQRMLAGALPYVDIWDRKPIGLFLIYALGWLVSGGSVYGYQLLATGFAATTAGLVFALARRPAGTVAAGVAGLAYLLWLELAEGGGGQAPVFYNALVAGGALATLRAWSAADEGRFRRSGILAMALVGVAIQIKYTVLFEGLWFGLVLALATLRRRRTLAAAIGPVAVFASVALLPTLIAWGAYAAMGHGAAFVFANFTSIFLRGPTSPVELNYRATMIAVRLAPFALCIAAAFWHIRSDTRAATDAWRLLMLGWLAAALIGLFSVGVLYSHYILPVFLPCAIAAAPIFGRKPSGPVLAALILLLPARTVHWPDLERTLRSNRQMEALAALVPADVHRTCLHMFDGPTALYTMTGACLATRFPFPDHLSAAIEARAIGADPEREVRAILARRPGAITIADADIRPPNRRTFSIMRAGLARHYRLAGRAANDGRNIEVWVSR